jgi:hypothetical protein
VPEARSPGSWPPEAGGTLLARVPVNDGAGPDGHVHRIRRKLGPDHGRRVVTVRRVGYRSEPPAAG